jgi:HSF-type DNA-binding
VGIALRLDLNVTTLYSHVVRTIATEQNQTCTSCCNPNRFASARDSKQCCPGITRMQWTAAMNTMTSNAQQLSLQEDNTTTRQPRHFVIHDYHDHAQEDDPCRTNVGTHRRSMSCTLFPMKLHEVLQDVEGAGMGHIVSWAPHGRCFFIYRPQEFVTKVLPR